MNNEIDNEELFDGEYHADNDEEENIDATIDAMCEWWRSHMSTTLISVLNPEKYTAAQKAIDEIINIINSIEDEETRPTYEVSYQIFGTTLELKLQLCEYDICIRANELKRIAAVLPEDSEITILPQKDYKASILFFFKNIKVIL